LPAQSGTFVVLSSTVAAGCEVRVDAADCSRLLELLALVPDPRKRRGVRHRVAAVLAVAAAAVLAGSRSVLAIGEWAAEAPQEVLAALGARRGLVSGAFTAPHVDTFRRVLRRVDADAVDAVIGLFLAGRVGVGAQDPAPGRTGHHQGQDRQQDQDQDQGKPIAGALAVDGKAMRGAVQPAGRAVHLSAAMTHAVPAVLAQRDVAHKTNEITQVKPLLEPLDLTGWVVTLDALHCQRETARYLVEDKGAGYVFTAAKDNQPRLLAALDALPWTQAPIGHTMRDRGHGRDETRTIQVLPRPRRDLPPRPPGVPGRTVRPRPERDPQIRGRRTRPDLPARPTGQSRTHRRPGQKPPGDRGTAPHPGCHLRRRPLPATHRVSPAGPRRPAQPGDRRAAHRRPHQDRSQPPVDLTRPDPSPRHPRHTPTNMTSRTPNTTLPIALGVRGSSSWHVTPARGAALGRPRVAWSSSAVAVAHRCCQASPMSPMRLIELSPDTYSLVLDAGTTDVDVVVEELGHEPNGYFWEGIAQLLVSTEAPTLKGRFSYDSEGGMFCAYGADRDALEELANRMSAVAADAERVRQLIAAAEANGFEFDD
jgi:predicted transposase YbfD/YdcC